ncbi:MAG: ATP-binding cassette domain-containing protein [Corynebacterium sp.]|uniref:ATP-binding cassette domain-containing protein n=1 Tax=Corynebacterium sp. TaxID=1720 RepID=UPI0026DCFE3B|nr:ATP-binding cassette domain-containing protein [Corynebacterium sp.]MDO5098784.1 ATP-binding cassette domain-containing protein [Corynebacterium sp.]
MSISNAIEIRGISKTYGKKKVIDDVSFDVVAGEITLLAGPNGAGKSTLLRMICGLEEPDTGSALIQGEPYRALNEPIQMVGSLLDATWLNTDLTAAQNLQVFAELAGIDTSRVEVCLAESGLTSVADRKVSQFSLGMRQRCGIAAAMLGSPKILILDEPVNGLDPDGMAWLNKLLKRHCASGGTVLISSHFLADSELLASRVVIIGRGKTLWQGFMSELTAGAQAASFQSENNEQIIQHLTKTHPGFEMLAEADNQVQVNVAPELVSRASSETGVDLYYLEQARRTLAEAYQQISEKEVEFR